MGRFALISVICLGGLLGGGCSSSSSPQSGETIKGLAPAEYREKAELSREIPAAPKAGKRSR